MNKRAWLGLVPIVCLLCLGTFYSVVRQVYGSKQNRQALVKQLKPDHDTISFLLNMRYLPKAIAKAEIPCWCLNSDSTTYLIYQQDTFRLSSAYHTLETPLGIAASGLCSHCIDFRIYFKSH